MILEAKIAVSEKKDGSMKFSGKEDKIIKKNRDDFLLKINVNPKEVVSAGLVHGNKVAWVGSALKGKTVPAADGLITKESNLFLCLTIADCLPVFLFNRKKGVVALIHAGWRGIAGHILERAVREMRSFSADGISARIGPGICSKHFEIKKDVLEKLSDYPESVIRKENKLFFDLKRAAKKDLMGAGLAESDVEIDKECTFCLKDKYFSYRRDGGEIKAMMALAGLTKGRRNNNFKKI